MSTSPTTTRFLQQENIRLKEEVDTLKEENSILHRYMNMAKTLYHMNQEAADADAPLEVLDQRLGEVIRLVDALDGSLSWLDEKTNEVMFVLVHGALREQLPGYRIKHNVGVIGWVLENQKPIIINNPRQDWRFSMEIDQEFSFLTRSIMSVPIMAGEKPLGAIQLLNKHNNNFTDTDIALLSILSYAAATLLQTIPLPPPIERQSETDDLFDQ